jgi:hypothetical protein
MSTEQQGQPGTFQIVVPHERNAEESDIAQFEALGFGRVDATLLACLSPEARARLQLATRPARPQ